MVAYNPSADTWTAVASMGTARWGLAVGVLSGRLYAVGGGSTSSTSLSSVEAYDPARDAWMGNAA